jgi:hypothetical protein
MDVHWAFSFMHSHEDVPEASGIEIAIPGAGALVECVAAAW